VTVRCSRPTLSRILHAFRNWELWLPRDPLRLPAIECLSLTSA
jgi:hypothetical protein